ncbi:hypothetical protein [Aquisphaera giovannonii]|uniref:hypothetical protein n=1 Tax=Aquisphaera giovannonii TaxID=406548 RepID=UPI0011E04D51|nr:hypothetical protein [Aquisphaera giovannonii]
MPNDEFREVMLKIARRSRPERRLRYRESLGTQMIGTLSLALGAVALMRWADIGRGTILLGRATYAWLYESPDANATFTGAARNATFIPPPEWTFARYWGIALAGQLLGIAGVWRTRRREGTFSLLSALGILACTAACAPMYLLILFCAAAVGWPFLLAVGGAAILMKIVLVASRR